jgi:hypothetical protein
MGAEVKLPPGNGPYYYRIAIWFHRYIRTREVSQDMDNFIFYILVKQQQNSLKNNQTTGVTSQIYWVI